MEEHLHGCRMERGAQRDALVRLTIILWIFEDIPMYFTSVPPWFIKVSLCTIYIYIDKNEEDGEEDEEGDEGISSSRKSRKTISERQPDSTGQQPPLQDFNTWKSTQASEHRKNRRIRRETG